MSDEPRVVVLVEWTDSAVVATEWTDRDEASAEASRLVGSPMKTAGFLIGTGPDHVALALSFNPNRDDVNLVIGIPRSAIIRMDVWEPEATILPDEPKAGAG